MFDYITWINWRRSYHEARKVYHENMMEFYKGQTDVVDKTQKMIVEFWSNQMSLFMLSILKPVSPTDLMGLWKK